MLLLVYGLRYTWTKQTSDSFNLVNDLFAANIFSAT